MPATKSSQTLTRWRYRLHRYRTRHRRLLSATGMILNVATLVMAVAFLTGLAAYAGFDHSAKASARIDLLLRLPQGVFVANILFGYVSGRRVGGKGTLVRVVIAWAVLLTVYSWVWPRPADPWMPWLDDFLYSKIFRLVALTAYAVFEISAGVMAIPGKRTNPAVILASSFLFFIIAGSFILMLPKCTTTPISYIDSLFVSSSAVCIAGLTPLDVATTFTPMGLTVIMILMQIGGVGVITVTSFFAISFSGSPSIYSQMMIRDMIYSKTMNSLIPTMLYIMAFTVVIELAGAVAVFFTIPDSLGYDTVSKMGVAVFHSVASFCNAGFSCIPAGMANDTLLHGNQMIYVVTSVLIFAGAIGFPILVNFKDIIKTRLQSLWCAARHRNPLPLKKRLYDINTRLVLVTYISILVVSSVAFFFLEYNNTLAGMDTGTKAVQSVFNSLTPRSAGFVSLNPASFMPVTLLLVICQMWIGGASQSLGGGIKVNTVAVLWLQVKSVIRGTGRPVAYNRAISPASISRAAAILFLSAGAFVLFSFTLLLLEPALSTKDILFEVISAVFTVGSSLGITAELGTGAKAVLCIAMFLGRLGILSLLCGFFASHKPPVAPHLPDENVIMN